MHDFIFEELGCTGPKGVRRLIIPFRRLLYFVLRPMLQRQGEIFQQLHSDLEGLRRRQEELDRLAQRLDERK